MISCYPYLPRSAHVFNHPTPFLSRLRPFAVVLKELHPFDMVFNENKLQRLWYSLPKFSRPNLSQLETCFGRPDAYRVDRFTPVDAAPVLMASLVYKDKVIQRNKMTASFDFAHKNALRSGCLAVNYFGGMT